jgi:ParB family chromosome partitioning protein
MLLLELPIEAIATPEWNATEADSEIHSRLRASILRFGLVVPLVVRLVGEGTYETIGGAQRLGILRELGIPTVQCVVVDLDDAEAQLLSQALNHIASEDNPGQRAALLRNLMVKMPKAEIAELLPETIESLEAISRLGQEDIASHLQAWNLAQSAKLRHFTVQLTPDQLTTIERALRLAEGNGDSDLGNPNRRGRALYRLCEWFLELERSHDNE